MSKECFVTGRKSRSGNNRSHAMNYTKRTFKPNLQSSYLSRWKPKSLGFCSSFEIW